MLVTPAELNELNKEEGRVELFNNNGTKREKFENKIVRLI
jgi:hypothetical protein